MVEIDGKLIISQQFAAPTFTCTRGEQQQRVASSLVCLDSVHSQTDEFGSLHIWGVYFIN